jgi:hypothetical protein
MIDVLNGFSTHTDGTPWHVEVVPTGNADQERFVYQGSYNSDEGV